MPGIGAAVKAAAKTGGKTAAKAGGKTAAKAAAPDDLVASGKSTAGEPLVEGDHSDSEPEVERELIGDQVDGPDSGREQQPDKPAAKQSSGGMSMPAGANSAGGFMLALMFWTWVALPFLQNGPTGVRNTLRAKFFNKAADGSWLP